MVQKLSKYIHSFQIETHANLIYILTRFSWSRLFLFRFTQSIKQEWLNVSIYFLFNFKYSTFPDNPAINKIFSELGASDFDRSHTEVGKYLSVVDEPVSNLYFFLIY
jgi:hypothetical protein